MLVANFPTSQSLYRSHEIRSIEQAAAMLSPSLMERAGEAAAELATQLLGNHYSVLVLAGPGNNGGDALVAATCLVHGLVLVTHNTVDFTGIPELEVLDPLATP